LSTNANTGQQPQAETPAATDQPLDLTKTLLGEDPPAAEPAPEKPAEGQAAPEATPAEGEGQGEAAAAATPPKEGEGQPAAEVPAATQPQPGTPDKALQKLQQDAAAALRKIDALEAKVANGQPLSQQDQQQLQQGKRKLDEVRQKLKANDVVDTDVAAAVVEQGDEVQQLRQQLQTVQQTLQQQQEQAFWADVAARYPGVNHREVLDKAWQDAAETIGQDNPALGKLASKLFHERVDAAAKSVAAKRGTTTSPPAPPAANKKPGTPVTPNGARVSVQTGVTQAPQPSEEDVHMRDYLSLVKET
jgi:hypothetical protein